MQTILIARNRQTGRDELLADRTVHLSEQKDMLRKLYGPHNDDYSEAVVAYVTACGPVMKFATKEAPRKQIKAPEPIKVKQFIHSKTKS
jgi:hypothetical protein